MNTADIISVLPDIPRIITALAQWLSCLVCIFSVKRRINGLRAAGISACFLVLQCIFMVVTDNYEGLMWNICMAGAVLLMFCFIMVCADIPWKNAVCCSATAFIISEFAASLEWQFWCYLHDAAGVQEIPYKWLLPFPVYGIIFTAAWQLCRSIWDTEEEMQVTGRDTAITVIAALLTFAVSNLGFLPVKVPFAGRDSVEIFNMRTLTDLGGLAIIYAYQAQWKSSYIQRELETIQTILNSQYEQYKQAQRTVDMINYRYHDLKNHIIALRADSSAAEQGKYLDKLEHEIHDYEALNKTGNQVLDTVLTSKNLRCMQHKIDMTCVIDGKLFSFMDVMDICSIFGNAIDNAIECELKIKDYGKRMIHVDAFSEKNFILIRFENYYEGEIRFKDGLPVTTKDAGSVHGYGLKSLRYTVKKYGGEMQISAEDNWFSLRILIPVDMKVRKQ